MEPITQYEIDNCFPSLMSLYREKPIITFQAETSYSQKDLQYIDPVTLDRRIKEELALKLVQQILDEDIIEFQTNHRIDGTSTIRAKLRIIQE